MSKAVQHAREFGVESFQPKRGLCQNWTRLGKWREKLGEGGGHLLCSLKTTQTIIYDHLNVFNRKKMGEDRDEGDTQRVALGDNLCQ